MMMILNLALALFLAPMVAMAASPNVRGTLTLEEEEQGKRQLMGKKKSSNKQVACGNFECPEHAYKLPGRQCYNNFEDCACFAGYEKGDDYCYKKTADELKKDEVCSYMCPKFSTPKPGRQCYNNFDDCECDFGYFKKGEQCFKDENCDYKCPAYSDYKADRFCYKSFADCFCLEGYYASGEKCVKKEQHPTSITLQVTNLSFQQPFGGFFVATHNQFAPPLFEFGKPASPELAVLAEDGDPSMLVDKYMALDGVGKAFAFNKGAPYFGGAIFDIEIPYDPDYPYVTVASMAINTNDCFVSINGVPLKSGDTFTGVGYDAGSEENNENCNSIPGPACAEIDLTNQRDGNGEGFVHVHRGFFGVGDSGLSAPGYDWRNPMVRWQVL